MWRISNNVNRPSLTRYSEIVDILFRLLIKLSKEDDKIEKIKDVNYLVSHFNGNAPLDSKLLTVNLSATDKLQDLLIKIIKLDKSILENEYKIYKDQNEKVNGGNFNLTKHEHPEPLTKLFKDYFYEKFFGIEWIWEEYVGKKYSRGMFKSDFQDENKLFVCTYCDTDTISNVRNSWIEHFLPKSKFPYVCVNNNNLIPSCTACNVSGSGKGDEFKNPIVNQISMQIGDLIDFTFIGGEITIPTNPNHGVENFIELLKLRNRYKEKNVHSRILSSLKINYNIVLQLKANPDFDKNLFLDFIQNNGRNNGLYFVQKCILKDIDTM